MRFVFLVRLDGKHEVIKEDSCCKGKGERSGVRTERIIIFYGYAFDVRCIHSWTLLPAANDVVGLTRELEVVTVGIFYCGITSLNSIENKLLAIYHVNVLAQA